MAWFILTLGFVVCNIMLVWGACPAGWMRFNDSCYKIANANDRVTWATAVNRCKSIEPKAHLVIVESDMENDFLITRLLNVSGAGKNIQFWMDGTDSAIEGHWIWEATGDSFEVKHYGPGEPNQNGGEEDCLSFFGIFDYLWNDEHCTSPEPYICELEDLPPDTGIVG